MIGIDDAKVCIATAGQGTRMGRYAEMINKSLLPVGGKAAITHIIEEFPADTRFVIALGYLGQQVRDYIGLAHPRLRVEFVEVDDWSSEKSGPGPTLLACRHLLDKPFIYVACDSIIGRVKAKGNWIGVAVPDDTNSASYCNIETRHGVVIDIHDKVATADRIAFTGMMRIETPKPFFTALENAAQAGRGELSEGFRALGDLHSQEHAWTDVGTLERYEWALADEGGFAKDGEFFYHVGSRVIKFFADPQIVLDRCARAEMRPGIFPEIVGATSQFYAYEWVPGETFYSVTCTNVVGKFLDWMSNAVWQPLGCIDISTEARSFYHDKTMARLASFRAKNPDWEEPVQINGSAVGSIDTLLDMVPWDSICRGDASFIHGDLQFDNIIYTETSFKLIDWRQDFGGRLDVGDLAYDFAKLIAGLRVDFSGLKDGSYMMQDVGRSVEVTTWAAREPTECEALIFARAEEYGISRRKLEIIVGLVYLSMAGLHIAPLDRLLYCLAQEQLSGVLLPR